MCDLLLIQIFPRSWLKSLLFEIYTISRLCLLQIKKLLPLFVRGFQIFCSIFFSALLARYKSSLGLKMISQDTFWWFLTSFFILCIEIRITFPLNFQISRIFSLNRIKLGIILCHFCWLLIFKGRCDVVTFWFCCEIPWLLHQNSIFYRNILVMPFALRFFVHQKWRK